MENDNKRRQFVLPKTVEVKIWPKKMLEIEAILAKEGIGFTSFIELLFSFHDNKLITEDKRQQFLETFVNFVADIKKLTVPSERTRKKSAAQKREEKLKTFYESFEKMEKGWTQDEITKLYDIFEQEIKVMNEICEKEDQTNETILDFD